MALVAPVAHPLVVHLLGCHPSIAIFLDCHGVQIVFDLGLQKLYLFLFDVQAEELADP